MAIIKNRLEAVDFTTSYWEGGLTFAVRIPAEDNMMFFTRPFRVYTLHGMIQDLVNEGLDLDWASLRHEEPTFVPDRSR